jgi:hypothetical protein
VPLLCEYTLAFALQLRRKYGKTSIQLNTICGKRSRPWSAEEFFPKLCRSCQYEDGPVHVLLQKVTESKLRSWDADGDPEHSESWICDLATVLWFQHDVINKYGNLHNNRAQQAECSKDTCFQPCLHRWLFRTRLPWFDPPSIHDNSAVRTTNTAFKISVQSQPTFNNNNIYLTAI